MLIKFSVSNYRGFNDTVCLDLVSKHDYRFNKECIVDGVVSKTIVYGKNSSGKSNLGKALYDIVDLLFGTNEDIDLNADSNQEYACFEYVFKKEDKEIRFLYKNHHLQKCAIFNDNDKFFMFEEKLNLSDSVAPIQFVGFWRKLTFYINNCKINYQSYRNRNLF